jgi:N-acetylglucosamine-6-sulfatase
MTDDQEDTGSMAYMPKLQALLAEQGVTFNNSFVNVPLCAPSRASFLTGQASHNTGIKANSPLDGGGWEAFKEKEANALPVWLKKAGYKTALIGKYLNHYGQQSTLGAWLGWIGSILHIDFKRTDIGNPRDWVPAGWDLWYAFTGTGVRYYDYSINENGTILNFGDRPSDYSTDVLKDRAVRFIKDEAATADPFFLLIATKTVHAQGERAIPSPKYMQAFKDVPLPASPAFNEKDLRRKAVNAPRIHGEDRDDLEKSYRAELQSLQSVDDLVEAVVAALKSAGKLDNTVIIYTSDNGFLFGEHRLIGKSAAYEESIKVPLVMRGPGIPANATRGQLVNNLDVVATILDLAGAAPGFAADGRSLAPLFADANAPWRSALLIESPVNRFESAKHRYTGVRTATRKYVKYDGGFEELFDLGADPHELNNEAGNASYAADLAALRSMEDRLKSCAGPSCWVVP